jgi:hypothetical protein
VTVKREASSRSDRIVIENAQGPETDVCGIMIVVKREMPMCAKPICFSVVAIFRADNLDHGSGASDRPEHCSRLVIVLTML